MFVTVEVHVMYALACSHVEYVVSLSRHVMKQQFSLTK